MQTNIIRVDYGGRMARLVPGRTAKGTRFSDGYDGAILIDLNLKETRP
jgi:hypothetical protein